QHGDDVGPDLGEAAVHEIPPGGVALPQAQLAGAQTADERGAAGQHAQFAVVHRQGDELGRLVEDRPLRRHDDALQLLTAGVHCPPYSFLAASTASSIGPTYMNACSGSV